jgi:type II secretory pathway component PulM
MTAVPTAAIEAWYGALAPQEQAFVRWGALAGGLLLVAGVVLQLHGVVGRAEQRLAAKRADVAYIQSVLPELRLVPAQQAANQSLVLVIDRTTRDAGLAGTLRATEPSGPSSVRVRFEGASFETLVTWLLRVLREDGLAVQAATFEKTTAPGRVNASLTFVRA